MKKIPNFPTFVNEKIELNDDFTEILKIMMDQPIDIILQFRDELKIFLNESVINESYGEQIFKQIKSRFRRWFTDKLFHYLINRKKEYYEKLVDKLNLFDIYTLKDVEEHFPSFNLRSMYLAGGMDAAKKGGRVGWRNIVEYELEFNHPGERKNVPEVEIYMGPNGDDVKTIHPSYVIDGQMLDYFLENTRKCLNLYNYPALLNPVRKEVDRNKMDFDTHLTRMKIGTSKQDDVDKAVGFFRDTFAKRIVPDDEHLINRADAIFLGLNNVAGAGTYAELQLLSFIEKPLFCALVEGYEGVVGNFKLWNMPQLCKIARNPEEMKVLVDTLWQYANQ